MPLQNRVTPFSTIEAVECRGLVRGNRGCLHDNDRGLRTQRWRTKSWIICRLAWKNARRQLMTPGSWTELFFLDEAVALAAGHRPCGYCRRDDYRKFIACWASGTGWNQARPPRQPDLDAKLHADRVDRQGRQRHHDAKLDRLQFGHGLGLFLHERPIISRLVSMDNPIEIQEGMVFALETYCPATDGYSAARIEEEVVVTNDGCRVITLFPSMELPIANKY